MTTFEEADWSEDSHMDECDPGAPLDFVAEAGAHRYDDFSHGAFVHKLRLQILPNDEEHREGFDNPTDFRIGDPNIHFQAAAAKPYETSGATGKPEWDLLFGFIRQSMFWSTIVTSPTWTILNLCNIGLLLQPGGPAVPVVVYFPISQASGLYLVHPTWAGTFVLAALCLVFPGLHIVLLDSDCVPVTLFEVEDLWQEAQRLQHSGFPGPVPTSSWAGGLNLDQANPTPLPKNPKSKE